MDTTPRPLFELTIDEATDPSMWDDEARHTIAAMLRTVADELAEGANSSTVRGEYHRACGAWTFSPRHSRPALNFAGQEWSAGDRPDLAELTARDVARIAALKAHERHPDSILYGVDEVEVQADDGHALYVSFDYVEDNNGQEVIAGATWTIYDPHGEECGTDGVPIDPENESDATNRLNYMREQITDFINAHKTP